MLKIGVKGVVNKQHVNIHV